MPFTLAHPAAVLPLMRPPLIGLALAGGAIAPDVPYFIRAMPLEVTAQSWYEPFTNATTSHTVSGLYITLVFAAVIYLLFRWSVQPVIWLLQGRWDGSGSHAITTAAAPHTEAPAKGTRPRWAFSGVWIPISLLIGIGSHLLWDSATDSSGLLSANINAVNTTAFGTMTWIRMSQHVSTVIGLAALGYFCWRRRTFLSTDQTVRRRALGILSSIFAIAAVTALAAIGRSDYSTAQGSDKIEGMISTAVKGAGAAMLVTAVIAVAIWWLLLLRRRHEDPVSASR